MGVFRGFPLDRKPGSIMIKPLYCLLVPAVLLADAAPTGSEQTTIDKSVFNLFNPTPAEHLRDMDRDGPGTTESPYTVDAGHFQLEMTLVSYTSDRFGGRGGPTRHPYPYPLKTGMSRRL
jgi:hypothetical protein